MSESKFGKMPSKDRFVSSLVLGLGSCMAGLCWYSLHQHRQSEERKLLNNRRQGSNELTLIHRPWASLLTFYKSFFYQITKRGHIEALPLTDEELEEEEIMRGESGVRGDTISPNSNNPTKGSETGTTFNPIIVTPLKSSKLRSSSPDTQTTDMTTPSMVDDDTAVSLSSTTSTTRRRSVFGARVTSKYMVNEPTIGSTVHLT